MLPVFLKMFVLYEKLLITPKKSVKRLTTSGQMLSIKVLKP